MFPRFAVRVACVVAFAAILARAVIPAGFMPDLNAVKPFSMVICTLQGAKTIAVDGDFDPTTHKAPPSCEFAQGLGDGITITPPALPPLVGGFGFLLFAYFYKLTTLRRPRYALAAPRAPPRIR